MIAAPYRRRGLGEAIVRAVEEFIIQDGIVQAIGSGVQVNNPGAIRFWRRTGYDIVSSAHTMQDGTVAYQLLKRIR
jgi:ribosomal protein S18 acetylase RimI-like enzyme